MINPGLMPWPPFISTEENQTSPKLPCVHESEDETKNLGYKESTDNKPRLCQWPIYRISGINQGNYIVVAVENSKECLCPTGHHLLLLTEVAWRGQQGQRMEMSQGTNGRGCCDEQGSENHEWQREIRDCGMNECQES